MSDLVLNTEDQFSHNEALIVSSFKFSGENMHTQNHEFCFFCNFLSMSDQFLFHFVSPHMCGFLIQPKVFRVLPLVTTAIPLALTGINITNQWLPTLLNTRTCAKTVHVISSCSETPLAKCDHIILLHPKSLNQRSCKRSPEILAY